MYIYRDKGGKKCVRVVAHRVNVIRLASFHSYAKSVGNLHNIFLGQSSSRRVNFAGKREEKKEREEEKNRWPYRDACSF